MNSPTRRRVTEDKSWVLAPSWSCRMLSTQP